MNEQIAKVREILNYYNRDKNALLEILQNVKRALKKIEPETIKMIAAELKIPAVEVEGVLTFYSFLGEESQGLYVIRLCKTISCALKNREEILEELKIQTGTTLNKTSSDKMFTLKDCNCLGMCDQGPALLINNVLLSAVTKEEIPKIISSCRKNNFNNDYGHRYISKIYKTASLYDFLENSESKFSEYEKISPAEILEKISAAGLRGRGGAGFPTALKWQSARENNSQEKYIICNADEGEPGTFKDRFLLDNYPNRVIEGLIIGARVINATQGIIYLRGEYEYLKDKIQKTINNYDFEISIHIGCGSYVCGEETALIESLEGHRGEARNKPPYPVEEGFKGKPTVVNNVETLVDVCLILEKGESYFRSVGTDKSTGTKFFSISGDCPNPGIYEMPFGVTVKELLTQIGATDVKSVQLGGASGKNIGIADFDKIIAYEAVPSGGSVIIFNKSRNMLQVARNFMEFFVDESCGQCVPCREGTIKILEGIDHILSGQGSKKYLENLVILGESIMSSAKCGLGQVCANAFISIINNHQDEILSGMEDNL